MTAQGDKTVARVLVSVRDRKGTAGPTMAKQAIRRARKWLIPAATVREPDATQPANTMRLPGDSSKWE